MNAFDTAIIPTSHRPEKGIEMTEGSPPRGLAEYEVFALELLAEAASHALVHFRQQPEVIDKAGDGAALDPVTAADREVEAAIRTGIRARYPEHAIRGEEHDTEAGSSEFAWMVDPIDGTRGFMSGFIHWGMLLALCHRGRPVLGVVHQPYTGEFWSGSARGARFRRGAEESGVSVRPCARLADATLATTDPYLFEGTEAEVFDALRRSVRLTRYGADCYAYCMLAMGQLDLVVESGLKPWDVQALMPLVTAAGGRITDWRGGDCSGGGRVVATGDPRLHEAAMAVLSRAAP